MAHPEDKPDGRQASGNDLVVDQKNTSASTATVETKNAELSPVKPTSILITPGTGATRRKTVSFGAQVANNEGKKSMAQGRSGLPSDFPGKFPSPWTPKVTEKDAEQNAQTERGRATKLTKTLYSIRESSRSRTEPQNADVKDDTTDLVQPKSESAQYWKQEYEHYAARTKQEMRKLVTKQKLAKSFARHKDTEVTELAGRLRNERRKVEKLESRTSELEAQMQEYRDGLAKAKTELETSKQRAIETLDEVKKQSNQQELVEWQEQQRRMTRELREAREESSSLRIERDTLRSELDEAKRANAKERRSRNRTDNHGNQASMDIWADAVGGTQVSADSVRTTIRTSPVNRVTAENSPLVSRNPDNKYNTPPKQTSPQQEAEFPSPKAVDSRKSQKTKSPSQNHSLFDSSLPLPQPSPETASLAHLPNPDASTTDLPPSSPLPNDAMSVPIRSFCPINRISDKPISKLPRKDSVVSKKEMKKENVQPNTNSRGNNKHNAHPTNDNLQVPAIRPSIQTKTSTKENAVPQNTLARASPGASTGEAGERRASSLVTRGGRQVSEDQIVAAQKRVDDRKKARELEATKPVSFR